MHTCIIYEALSVARSPSYAYDPRVCGHAVTGTPKLRATILGWDEMVDFAQLCTAHSCMHTVLYA